MFKIKQFIHQYYKTYILTICLLWLLAFFLPMELQIGGVSVYFFIMKKLFVFLGVLAILFSALTKRNHIPQIVKSAGFFKTILKIKNEKIVKAILNKAHKGR